MKHGAEKRDFILKLINKLREDQELPITKLYKALRPKFVEWQLRGRRAVKVPVPINYEAYRKWIAYFMKSGMVKYRRAKVPGAKKSIYLISKKPKE